MGQRLDSRLATLMAGKRGLERSVSSRSESPQVEADMSQGWFGKWSLRGVGASKFEFRPAAAAA